MESERSTAAKHQGKAGPGAKRLAKNRLTREITVTIPVEMDEVLWHITNELQQQSIRRGKDPTTYNRSEVFRGLVMMGYREYVERNAVGFLKGGLGVIQVMGLTNLPQSRLRALARENGIQLPPPTEKEDDAEILRLRNQDLEGQVVQLRQKLGSVRRVLARQGVPDPTADPASAELPRAGTAEEAAKIADSLV